MGILLWIVRIIGLLLLVRLALRLLFGTRGVAHAGGAARGRPASAPEAKPGGELVRDPNCGTYVPKTRAIAVSAGRETLYFCSATCRDAHLAKAGA